MLSPLEIGYCEFVVLNAVLRHAGLPGLPGLLAGERRELLLDGRAVAALLEAGSSANGSSGDTAPWADEACWQVCGWLGDGVDNAEESWWQACCLVAQAALRFDEMASAALCDQLVARREQSRPAPI